MGPSIRPGRVAGHSTSGVAVFLIGMRINRWYRPDAWLPALLAMGPMLAELYRDPGTGFRGHRMALAGGGPMLVQYWDSAEDVLRYARAGDRRHRPAWAAFNGRARRAPGAVGIWHELYEVPPGAASSTFVDMPVVGLAAASDAAVSDAAASDAAA